MLLGRSPALSVFYATVLAFALSFLTRETALTPKRLVRALSDGSTSVLTAAITCATAGIIVGVVTLTGLGQKFADIVISYAGGSLLLTAIFTALVVWIIGLAVPVTASYIICAVIAAPAMIKLGVPPVAAHMFIFYYSVLSEVSPPTALSPFAAAAITGGDPYKTTLQAWKYTLPAFLVPFVFVLDPQGIGLLLQIPKDGSWIDIVLITAEDRARAGRARVGGAGLGAPQDHACRAPAAAAGRPADGVPGLARGRSWRPSSAATSSYTATFGILIAAAVLIKQWMLPAPPDARRPADVDREDVDDETAPTRCAISSAARLAAVAFAGAARRAEHEHRASPPAAPAASTIRSAAAWRTCCRNTCPACRRRRA